MLYTKRNLPKKKAEAKRRISSVALWFTTFNPKKRCDGSLTEASQERARKAYEFDPQHWLESLNGKLRCNCGEAVGAYKLSSARNYFVPKPHEPYKSVRQPAGKKNFSK